MHTESMFKFAGADITDHPGAPIVLMQNRKPAVCVARSNDDLQLITEGLDCRRHVNTDYFHLPFDDIIDVQTTPEVFMLGVEVRELSEAAEIVSVSSNAPQQIYVSE